MRIGFTGAHGTGKTSLMKAICSDPEFKAYPPVPSTARKMKQAGYSINRDADELSQLMTLLARVTTENKIYESYARVISDRTPVDSLAYTAIQIESVWENCNPEYWKVCKELTRQHMQKYSAVYYFPVYWEPYADGDRDPDPEYQRRHAELVLHLLNEFDIDFWMVPEGSTADRLEWFRRTIH